MTRSCKAYILTGIRPIFFNTLHILIYNYELRAGSYSTKAEFERLADFILRDYLGNAYDGYDPLDIQAFAKDYLKLDISYFAFDPDTRIEGMRTGNQIILDDRLLDDKKAGERNFTIAHECGHDLINWQDPSYSPQTVVNYRIKSSRKSLVTEDDSRNGKQMW